MSWLTALLAGLPLLAGLLWAERGNSPGRILACKTSLSLLFVLAAFTQPHPLPGYYALALAGLILGLLGDVLLALKTKAAFKAGLAAFLLGHLAYVAAFGLYTEPMHWVLPGVLLLWAVAFLVFRWLKPHLGDMRVPVAAYVIVITLMLWAAWAALWGGQLPAWTARLGLAGAVCFYLSDIFVARERFVTPGFANRLWGLPLYYVGQFLIAFSVGQGPA
ncbi:hypothetical protein AAU61_04695 [Desulfocarbo indianensis]|nr:hypothetical protein AAU61_04695 [Desulfocarbo indianensis]